MHFAVLFYLFLVGNLFSQLELVDGYKILAVYSFPGKLFENQHVYILIPMLCILDKASPIL